MLPSTLDILPSTLDILPSTLDFVPSTLDPRPSTKTQTQNTAVLAKWESANIDFICFANKGVNHRHRKSRPGIPRDSPRFVFQFARAAADHFLRKNLRNLRSGTMVANVACRYFPSAKRKV